MPLSDSPLALALDRYAERTAISSENFSFTYPRYLATVAYVKTVLINEGIRPGQRVACLMENRVEYPIVLMALLHLGATAVCLSTRFPAMLVLKLAQRAGADTLITSRNALPVNFEAKIKILYCEELVNFRAIHPTPSFVGDIDPDGESTIMFTSGATGTPKPVVLTFTNHYFNALGSNANIKLSPDDRWLVSLPLYHVGGQSILYRCLLSGATAVIAADSRNILEQIQKLKITHLSLVSTQLYRLLHAPNSRAILSGIKAILIGGSMIPPSLIKEAYAKDFPLFVTYGLTEMASQVTTSRPDDPVDRLLTAGTLLPDREIKFSARGEILVRGATLFKGYIEEENIHRPADADGWFPTGDTGFMTGDGYLVVTGRMDNMFISGGENIQPEEIEQSLCNVDGVRQAVVVPVDNEEFGNRPVAFVKTKDEMPDEQALKKALSGCLPGFKIPDRFFAWPEKMINPDGKPERKKLTLLAAELIRKHRGTSKA